MMMVLEFRNACGDCRGLRAPVLRFEPRRTCTTTGPGLESTGAVRLWTWSAR